MNSSQVSKVVIISAVLAAIGFALTSIVVPANPFTVAIMVFIASFVTANTLNQSSTSSNSDNEQSSEEENADVKTLYVGNLPYRANEMAIRELFSTYGTVHSVRLMKDKHTGKRRGFGFVEISANDAESAITALNDQEFQQRTLKVREAKERPEKTTESE